MSNEIKIYNRGKYITTIEATEEELHGGPMRPLVMRCAEAAGQDNTVPFSTRFNFEAEEKFFEIKDD